MKEKFSVEPGIGSVPDIKTQYWFVRSNYINDRFVTVEAEWVGGISDLFRLAKGNVYLSEEEANNVMLMMNKRLESIRSISENAMQREKLEEEKASKKAEAAERKRQREASKNNLTKEEKKLLRKEEELLKSKAYEAGKKKRGRKPKSPHPDIIM